MTIAGKMVTSNAPANDRPEPMASQAANAKPQPQLATASSSQSEKPSQFLPGVPDKLVIDAQTLCATCQLPDQFVLCRLCLIMRKDNLDVMQQKQ